MMALVNQLKKENSKFRLRRFSIQKLNGFMSDNLEDLKYKLNTNLFYRDQKYLRPGYETEYKDFFILDEPEAHLHNTRLFRVGGNTERPTYQAIVDTFGSIDVFMSPELPNIEIDSLADVSNKLDNSLRNSFAETLKRDYIESL